VNKPDIEFQEWPKIARFSREVIVTEKIDGTNAQIYIPEPGELQCECGIYSSNKWHLSGNHAMGQCDIWHDGDPCMKRCTCTSFRPKDRIYAGSRTKWITPQDDNMGFANWVWKNQDELLQLGPGHHYGEWWGKGIQRGYGVPDKRFSLFNVSRWGDTRGGPVDGGTDKRPVCCGVVPTLWRGNMDLLDAALGVVLNDLRTIGSQAAPGFMKPEGVVIFHVAANMSFKKTLEKDEQPKGMSK
jgi:hypothetical protein